MAVGRKERRRKINSMILLMSVGSLVLHLAVSENYQLHRDAFLYLDYADHPAWGYISVPPFIMIISMIAVKILGGSAFVIRLFPAIASAVSVGLVGNLTKELGGKRWAVLITTLAYALSPAFLRSGSLFQPETFNQMFWVIFFYLFIQMLRSKNLNYWYLIGFFVGIGMLNKYSMSIPLVSVVIGLLVTGKFNTIFCRQFWIGMLGVVLIMIPNLIWQYNHNWPVLYHINELEKTQFLNLKPIYFMNMQVLMNSHGMIIWILGLIGLVVYKPLRSYMSVFVAFIVMLLTLLFVGAKPYYMLGIYPALFVFGGLYLQRLTIKKDWILPIVTGFMAFLALIILPLSLPFLKAHNLAKYSNAFMTYGVHSPFIWEDGELHPIPQDFADMLGWEEMAISVQNAYQSLSTEEQNRAILYGSNYGKVGAVNYYNRRAKMGLPQAHTFNGSYIFWTPESVPEDCILIFIGNDTKIVDSVFNEVILYEKLDLGLARENGAEIYICRKPKDEFYELYDKIRGDLFDQFYRKRNEH